MATTEPRNYNNLLQLNGTILIGLFIFTSLNPLIFNNFLDLKTMDEIIAIHQEAPSIAQDILEINIDAKQNLQRLLDTMNTANLSASDKAPFVDIIKMYESAIDLDEKSLEMLTQLGKLQNETKDVIIALSKSVNSETAYFVTIVVMIPFMFSIVMILVDKHKTAKLSTRFAAKFSTSVGLFLIIIALFYFYAIISEQTRELSNLRVQNEGNIIKIGENILDMQAKGINITKTIQSVIPEKTNELEKKLNNTQIHLIEPN